MEQILSTDAEGFYAWARILVEGHALDANADEEVMLDFFGQDDETFLVVDICKGEKVISEYVFCTANENDKDKTLLFIFDFLRTLDFSVNKGYMAAAQQLKASYEKRMVMMRACRLMLMWLRGLQTRLMRLNFALAGGAKYHKNLFESTPITA